MPSSQTRPYEARTFHETLWGYVRYTRALGYRLQSMASAAMKNAPAREKRLKKAFFLPCSQETLFWSREDWKRAVFGEEDVRKTGLTWSKSPFLDKPSSMTAAHILIWLGRRVSRHKLWLVFRQPRCCAPSARPCCDRHCQTHEYCP